MCNTPRTIFKRESGMFVPYVVACRKCWQCRGNRVWDWVGRAVAENECADRAFFVTLTYGNSLAYGEELADRARSLHYPDVQKWLKRIRKKHRVRYVVTGEYGSKKGRAHWHALLFFKGDLPDVRLNYKYWGNREFNVDPFWSHGLTEWAEFEPAAARYVCKYMLKAVDELDNQERHAMLSKFPPLGHEYFMKRAERYVDQGLSPQDLVYSFPHVTYGKRNPKAREYVLQGVSADNFLAHYVETWRARHGRDNWPYSQLIEDWLDAESAGAAADAHFDMIQARPSRERHSLERPWYVPPQALEPEKPCDLKVDRRLNLWAISDPSAPFGAVRYWSFDEWGFSGWHDVPNLVTAEKAASLRADYAASLKPPSVDLATDRRLRSRPRP